jgi:carboxypeptidase A
LDEERIAQKRADVRDRWDAYQPLSEILSWLDTTSAANPSIAQTEVIGKSYANNDLKLIKIGEGVANKNKPIILIDSAIHAREWITPAFTTALIQKLLDGYNNNDPEIRPLVQKFDWYILPVLNPDGYAYSFTTVSFIFYLVFIQFY